MIKYPLFFSLVFLFFYHSASLAASVDPAVRWRTLNTPHFEIIFDQTERRLADAYAVAAEQAFDILKNRFSEKPEKTFVLIMDNTDFANGSATFIPYPIIQVFPSLPDTLDSLDYYGNWPLEMMTHEYTHILTFEPTHGFIRAFKYVFGSIVRPNGILPRWYLEGLAVESESRFGHFGRLKSPHTFAELRALSQDGQLNRETIDRINETLLPEYPYGERPYLFGSVLWEHMIQTGPDGIVEELNQRYSRRVPSFLNAPVEDIFHLDYRQLLEDTYSQINENAKKQIETIEAKRKESSLTFREQDMNQFSPAISPDGRSLVYFSSAFRRAQIRIIQRDDNSSFSTHASKKLYDIYGALRMSWLPDSQSFVFDSIDEMDHYHEFHALYEYDIKSRKVTQLTSGIRAQDPGVSLNGQWIAFIDNEGGKNGLGIFDRSKKTTKVIYSAKLSERLSSPEFISDHEIAFTERRIDGEEHLYVYDLTTENSKLFFLQDHELRRPKRTKLGLLVATTSSGVENIAIADLEKKKLKPITNSTTEIETADWDASANELIATRLTGKGRRLIAMPMSPVTSPTTPPAVGSMISAKWPTPPEPSLTMITPITDLKDESYLPVKYLLPRYWIPFIYPVYNGLYMQGATTMSDPVGIHSYTTSVAYDTVTHHGSFGVQYVNSSLPPDIELSYVNAEVYLGATGFIQNEETSIGDLAFFLPGLSSHWKGMAGYMNDHVHSPFNGPLSRQGPIASLIFSNWNDPRTEGAGTIFQLSQQQFIPVESGLHYGRTLIEAIQGWKRGLPKDHRITVSTKAAFAPNLPFNNILSLGDSSLGANYLVSLSNAEFLFRGYLNGTFVGRKTVNWNIEYQFPMSKKYYGWDTKPLFSRGWDGVIFFDGIGVDGAAYNPVSQSYYTRSLGDIALSTGFEAHWNTTFAYNMPVTGIFGLYAGFDSQARNSVMPFVGLALSDMSAINHLRDHWFKHL